MPLLERALLLHLDGSSPCCPRRRFQRTGYAFCPLCISRQPVRHLSWDWCFACVVRCSSHGIPLLDACPHCNELDPVSFDSASPASVPICCSCGGELSGALDHSSSNRSQASINVVQEAYRTGLLGLSPDSPLFGHFTSHAFRRFVDDMLQTLILCLNPQPIQQNMGRSAASLLPRHKLLSITAALVSNAVPTSDARLRRASHSRDLQLWGTLLDVIPKEQGTILEDASRRWPLALRRRFASALHKQKRKHWPHTPFRGPSFRPRFKYSMVPAVREFSARNKAFLASPRFEYSATTVVVQ